VPIFPGKYGRERTSPSTEISKKGGIYQLLCRDLAGCVTYPLKIPARHVARVVPGFTSMMSTGFFKQLNRDKIL
jgi:hypothetical protein